MSGFKTTPTIKGTGFEVVTRILVNADEVQADEALKVSSLGTPIFSNLVFPERTYETLEGDEITFSEISFDSVLFVVNQSKNIVKTAIQGRNGTIKEYISDGDYSVSISLNVTSENQDVYPEAEIVNLIEILKAPVSLRVESEYLNLFDIEEIVIESFDAPQEQGSRNTQNFSITAISDEPIELRDLQNL